MHDKQQQDTTKSAKKMHSKKQDVTSHKKIKVIGTETYINQQTGEIQPMQVISLEDRDFNFTKIWMQNIINSIDLIGNQKTRLAFWIIQNLNRENQLVMTQKQIAKKSGISLRTVATTMKVLVESNFLRKINGGAYCVNPDILFKGTRNNRLNVLLQYNLLDDSAAQPSDEKPDEPPTAAGNEKEKSSSSIPAPRAAQSDKRPDPAQPDRMMCPCCGEEVTPRIQHDKRPGHAGEIFYECPNCETELNLEGAKSA